MISYIRDNRSHEIIRRLTNAKTETLMAHETPTTPGRDLDLIKLLARAELLSREEFPKVLKGLGLAGKPNTVKEDANYRRKSMTDLQASTSSTYSSPCARYMGQ